MNWNPWKRIRELEAEIAQRSIVRPCHKYAALKAISACETPGANATVKRMAKIAREALGE